MSSKPANCYTWYFFFTQTKVCCKVCDFFLARKLFRVRSLVLIHKTVLIVNKNFGLRERKTKHVRSERVARKLVNLSKQFPDLVVEETRR